MKKIIFRFLIFTLLLVFSFITYLSTIGIKTDVFNDQISKELKKINDQLELDLNKINIILDPFKFKLVLKTCLLYTSPSPRDKRQSRMPSSA